MRMSGEKRETEAMCKTIMTENTSKLMLDTKPQIQEVQRASSRINAKTRNINISEN